MGREVMRVPLDFEWPINKIWQGYLMPDELQEGECPDCKSGYSPRGQYLHSLWYGHVPFRPEDNGSTPLTVDAPVVRAYAERNVARSPEFFGSGELAIHNETYRLIHLWNRQWCHHLNADDVAALLAGDHLRELTHRFVKGTGWVKRVPEVVPTPEEVNAWSITNFMGLDSISAFVAIRARCEREGVPFLCSTCDGHASVETYPGQRADADAWERENPPTGEGWQLWETVSEGSPISPVFATAEELAQWLTTPAACWGAMKKPLSIEQARGFVGAGWAPSLVATVGRGVQDGAAWVGDQETRKSEEGS